jgi:hypothetical protein
MQLNAGTKIDDLLNRYPFLLDFLITLSPHFENLKDPQMRKTMGKTATLEMAASIAGLETDALISALTDEIDKQKLQADGSGGSVAASFEESLTDPAERQKVLKAIIRDLHGGEDTDVLKQRFRQLVRGVEASEIAKMEQALMNEGLPPEEIKALCNVHVEIFKDGLAEQDRPYRDISAGSHPGHPGYDLQRRVHPLSYINRDAY